MKISDGFHKGLKLLERAKENGRLCVLFLWLFRFVRAAAPAAAACGLMPPGDVFVQWFVYSVARVPRDNVVASTMLPKPQTTSNSDVFLILADLNMELLKSS